MVLMRWFLSQEYTREEDLGGPPSTTMVLPPQRMMQQSPWPTSRKVAVRALLAGAEAASAMP